LFLLTVSTGGEYPFPMSLNEADTRAKLIDPAIHKRGWTEDLIRREETAGNPPELPVETKTRMFAA